MKLRNGEMCLLCLMMLVSISAIAANSDLSAAEREGAEIKMLRIKEALQKQDVNISFWGQVLDQSNTPVEGASVAIHIVHFIPDEDKLFGESKSITVQTDKTGVFSVEKEIGRSLHVQGISVSGYEYVRAKNPSLDFQYAEHGNQKPFIADKKTPVIFRLRKQSDTAFLLETMDWNCQIAVSESGKSKGYDLVRREPVRDMARLVLNDEPLVCDIRMKAAFITNATTWTVVLSPGNTTGGIIVSEQLLFEAPDTGYQPEYAFTPEERKPLKTKYVYLRSRNPAIYSRLEIEYCTVDKKFVRIRGKSVTNPYGDRNLEQSTDLPYEVTKRLTDEAKTAFRQNKRPSKPDLAKLIKEVNEKAEKDKGKP